RAWIDPASFGDQALVVVLPARAWQSEQALTLCKAHFWIGIRIDENIAVIESSKQLDRVFAQHAIAEHVTRHVADTSHVERGFADIDICFAEVSFHRFPGATRGDAHGFVVIAG